MKKYIVGIGAANIDVYGKSKIKIQEHFDHPSVVKTAVGGVTRNVLENAARLGVDCKMLTAVGDDIYGDYVISHSSSVGIDMSKVLRVKNQRTGLFMQVQDKNNDMYMALCDMEVLKNISVDYISKHLKMLNNASLVVIDPSLDKKVLDYLFENVCAPIYVDPISEVYAKKMKPYLSKIACIKPNKTELGVLANMKVNDDNLLVAYKKVLQKGVKKLVVSLGDKGCLYEDESGFVTRSYLTPVKKMVNASGAGDAFMSCLLYGAIKNLKMEEMIPLALASGKCTVMNENVIHPKMSIKLLKKTVKEETKNEL